MLDELPLVHHLKHYFGYNSFRDYQEEIIHELLKKKDVIAILPTGAGKSICYQLPALVSSGTAILISPLISLMQDQVTSLTKNGISAAFLNSSLHYRDVCEVLENLSLYKFIYVAPERFADERFINALKNTQVAYFVVDEAHCISQWGHSFRGDYRKLSLLKEQFPQIPIIAVTATATKAVENDIRIQLQMKDPILIKGGFNRPNLTLHIQAKDRSFDQLCAFIKNRKDKSGIIYASTRKGVDQTFAALQRAGFSVGRYHAGMTDRERTDSQEAFICDRVLLMVATVAFGMGIHKPDIRYIVHIDMPQTIEHYYQEIGRAGRDGLPAECLMLFGLQDVVLYKRFAEELTDQQVFLQTKKKIEAMYRLCTSRNCRRKELLNYFGEKFVQESCRSCDNCLQEENDRFDATEYAQQILSCVYRLKQNVGYRMLIDVLRGSKNQNLLNRQYDQLSTYGLMSALSEEEIRYYIDSLIYDHFLVQTSGDYPVLKWTENASQAIKDKKTIYFKKRYFKQEKKKCALKINQDTDLHFNSELFEELKILRTQIASESKVPPYVIFSDRALQEMAFYYPQSREEMSRINGVGPIKWVRYGQSFLDIITSKIRPHVNIQQNLKISPLNRQQSTEETLAYYLKGFTIDEIAIKRNLVKGTIISHFEQLISKGMKIDLSLLIPVEKQRVIQELINDMGTEKLKSIKERLPDEYSYDEIRLMCAHYNKH